MPWGTVREEGREWQQNHDNIRLRPDLNGTSGQSIGKRVARGRRIENSFHLLDGQEAHKREMRVKGTHNCVLDVGHALRACRFSKKALLSTELRPWCKKRVSDLEDSSRRRPICTPCAAVVPLPATPSFKKDSLHLSLPMSHASKGRSGTRLAAKKIVPKKMIQDCVSEDVQPDPSAKR